MTHPLDVVCRSNRQARRETPDPKAPAIPGSRTEYAEPNVRRSPTHPGPSEDRNRMSRRRNLGPCSSPISLRGRA